jgi:hypothetical protein
MKRACLFFTWMWSILFACCDTTSADDVAKPLALEKSDQERQLPQRLLGASAEGIIEHLTDDPHKVAALKAMDLAFVRFPGGSQSNFYDWRTGLLDFPEKPQSSAYMRFWAEIAPKIRKGFPHGVKIAEYTQFAKQLGAEVVLVPNLETSSIAEQVEWFRQMKAAGIVPRYIELGNEFWIAMAFDPDSLKRWPDEPTSMRIMKQYYDALRPYFPPDARVAVQSAASAYWLRGNPTRPGGRRLRQWDLDLKPEPWFDAVTIHPYPRMDTIMGEQRAAQGWHQPEKAKKLFPALLAHCDQGIDRVVEDVRQRLPNKEIWVTEWNTRGADYQATDLPTPAMHIQLVSRVTFALLRHREVTMSLFFTLNFLRQGPASGAFQPDGQGGYRPMPHVLALRWFHEAVNGGATYQRFLEAGARRVPGGGVLDESYFEVEAGLFRKSKAVTLIIQNCAAESRVFRLPKSVPEKAPSRVETLATPDLTATSANVTPASQSVEAGGKVPIPAYSITRIVWR